MNPFAIISRSHWTKQHHDWLQRTIESQAGSLKVNLGLLYHQLQDIDRSLAEYNQQFEALAQTERNRCYCHSRCFVMHREPQHARLGYEPNFTRLACLRWSMKE